MTLRADQGVNVVDLHPVFRARLEALFATPGLGRLRVVSGVREKDLQAWLRLGYVMGWKGFNFAADPNQIGGRHYGIEFRGSPHMRQADGFGYAVDVNHLELTLGEIVLFERRLDALRLARPVTNPWEPWHIQMSFADWTWTPPTEEENDVGEITNPDQKHQLAVAADLAAQDHPVIGDISARLARVEALLERLLDHLEGGR